jgi:hypothetical protein
MFTAAEFRFAVRSPVALPSDATGLSDATSNSACSPADYEFRDFRGLSIYGSAEE